MNVDPFAPASLGGAGGDAARPAGRASERRRRAPRAAASGSEAISARRAARSPSSSAAAARHAALAHHGARRRCVEHRVGAPSARPSRRSPPPRVGRSSRRPRGDALQLRGSPLERVAARARPRPRARRAGPAHARRPRGRESTRARPAASPGDAGAPRRTRSLISLSRSTARWSAAMIERGRGGARVLVADRALAEVGRAALAGLERHRRLRPLLGGRRGGGERRLERLAGVERGRSARRSRDRARRPWSCRPAGRHRARRRRRVPRGARRPGPGRRAPRASPSARPARRNAVPQSGPLAPPTVDTSVLPANDQELPGRERRVLRGQRLADRVEAAVHVHAVVAVADRGVQLGQVVAPVLDGLRDRGHPGVNRRGAHRGSCDHRLYAPQWSAGVWTGASHRAVSSSSSSSSVSDAPAISSEVM